MSKNKTYEPKREKAKRLYSSLEKNNLPKLPYGFKKVSINLLETFNTYTRLLPDFEKNEDIIGMLYLSPEKTSEIKTSDKNNYLNLCKAADKCPKYCFFNSGKIYQATRNTRTLWYSNYLINFMNVLAFDILKLAIIAKQNKKNIVIRLNGLSDIQWENETFMIDNKIYNIMNKYTKDFDLNLKKNEEQSLFDIFPKIKFYDYTKYLPQNRSSKNNYYLIYSLDTHTSKKAKSILNSGNNIAVIVLDINKIDNKVCNYETINGDNYDNRINDKTTDSIGKIVLLKADFLAKKFKKNKDNDVNSLYIIEEQKELENIINTSK